LPNLIDSVRNKDFQELEDDVIKIKTFLKRYFKEHNIKISEFEKLEEFKNFLGRISNYNYANG